MALKITPEYLSGYLDACGKITLQGQSKTHPKLLITMTARRKQILEASAAATRMGVYSREAVNGGYMYHWRIDDDDHIVKFFRKLRDYVVVHHKIVEAMLEYAERQQQLDDLLADKRKEFLTTRIQHITDGRNESVRELIRAVNDSNV